MEHEPRGLLGDLDRPRELVAADPILAVHDQPHGREPLGQADRAPLEDGADLDRELLLAVPALPNATGGQEAHVLGVARRALGTVLPTEGGNEVMGDLLVREVGNGFDQGGRGVLHVPIVGGVAR